MTVRRAEAQSGLVPVDARALLTHVLGVDRAWLIAHASEAIASERAAAFFALARRRREGEPIAYLTGHREFWGLDFAVTPAVLIPRPETETLVEIALVRLPADRPGLVLDIGTGCGAIALAIARERPLARVVATDVAQEALEVARRNANRLGIANVRFVPADLFPGRDTPEASGSGQSPHRDAGAAFDLVVSNPPYVPEGDPHLAQGDLRHEPRGALVAGRDGLAVLRRIVEGAPPRMRAGGSLVVEHGHDQSEAVQRLMREAGLCEIVGARDLAGIPRVAAGRKAS